MRRPLIKFIASLIIYMVFILIAGLGIAVLVDITCRNVGDLPTQDEQAWLRSLREEKGTK